MTLFFREPDQILNDRETNGRAASVFKKYQAEHFTESDKINWNYDSHEDNVKFTMDTNYNYNFQNFPGKCGNPDGKLKFIVCLIEIK